MEKSPIKVKLIGKNQEYYQIQFPNLQIPVQVNYDLYNRMKNSEQYRFIAGS
jgi:hypothetical protein